MKEPLVQCNKCRKLRTKEQCENVIMEEKAFGINTGKSKAQIMCKPCIAKINDTPEKESQPLL